MRILVALLVAGVSGWAPAQATDPMHSAQCRNARAELDAATDEAAAARMQLTRRLDAARRAAARACLGPSATRAVRSGAPEPPGAVPPPVISIAPEPKTPLVADVPRPPLQISRPAMITTCDPSGCWDTEGRRLNQLGPVLAGPRGACSLQAGVVVCP